MINASRPLSIPGMQESDRVIVFDGVCKLCSATVNFIIQHDAELVFKLCSAQSEPGQHILRHFNLPTDHYESVLLVQNGEYRQKSAAFFRIMAGLGYPWKLLLVFKTVPRPLRDWFYDLVASNRYKIFGRYDQCTLPQSDHASRFLDDA